MCIRDRLGTHASTADDLAAWESRVYLLAQG
jgi:hypothetical protein